MPFVDRTREMQKLTEEYYRKEASFVVAYGRRRLGKTTLLSEFCKGKNAIRFLATEENFNTSEKPTPRFRPS